MKLIQPSSVRMVMSRNKTFWLESLKVRHHLEDIGIDKRIILNWTLGKYGRRVGLIRFTGQLYFYGRE
jgi:hypothetical protein